MYTQARNLTKLPTPLPRASGTHGTRPGLRVPTGHDPGFGYPRDMPRASGTHGTRPGLRVPTGHAAGFIKHSYHTKEPMRTFDEYYITWDDYRKHALRCEQLYVTTKLFFVRRFFRYERFVKPAHTSVLSTLKQTRCRL